MGKGDSKFIIAAAGELPKSAFEALPVLPTVGWFCAVTDDPVWACVAAVKGDLPA